MLGKGLLLDRDGIINLDRGYVGHRDQFEFREGIFPFLRSAQELGFRLAILTNQAGVARGYYTENDFWSLTAWMLERFRKEGVSIERVFVCFLHREGTIDSLRRESYWRKPNPGMVLEALQKLNLNPKRSCFVGDKKTDMEAGEAAHLGSCLWMTDESVQVWSNIKQVYQFEDALKQLTLV